MPFKNHRAIDSLIWIHVPSNKFVGFLCIGELLGITQLHDSSTGGQKIADQMSDCFMIFIHAQQSGLYRIRLKGPLSRYS